MGRVVNVRPYSYDDLAGVVALFGRSVRGIAGRDYDARQVAAWAPSQPDMEAWAKRLSTGHVVVAEASGQLAGFARLERSGLVDLLFVDPGHERQGVASCLMSAVLDEAARLGVERLSADVSITARPFFASHGFHVVREQRVSRAGVEYTNYHMERPLP